jgi:hypothetical protein
MKLVAVGDSFTYGEELSDRSNCFANLVAKQLGYNCVNHGIPGGSNWRAVRYLMNENLSDCGLVIVGWSHYDRFEVADEAGIFCNWPGGNRTKFVQEAKWRKTIVDYYTEHHNDDFLYNYYLMQIIFIQNFCENNKIPLIMMDAFGNNIDPRRQSKKFRVLEDQINPEIFIGWPNSSMMDWAKDTPHGPGNHFLDEGHSIVADKVIQTVKKIYEL